MNTVISGRSCEVMQYWEYMDVKDIPSIVKRIKALTNLKSWCIITHDKAVSDCSPHYEQVDITKDLPW